MHHQSAKPTCSVEVENRSVDCVAKCDSHDESDDEDEDVDSFEHNSVQEFEIQWSCVLLRSFCRNAQQLFYWG